ncbi:hypothetical protein BBO99_00008487 [Phytophthora kernoviae]|uniref:Necrosis inducing-like protein NPP1 type n=2 Tax=Phytophthora kernoviae TaxID=325452 RepID=A0A3R7HDT6_9STRA|nr:hypothetical protein G195_010070 [Phytophthora kernoviae 00238/432]KAG2515058.1 hypothetical protein JM18_008248 [Phytophthora kernoviae]RLN02179.1 hypothetical protein BBI17_008448 [Phytophthora kernoviae]RLN75220.1 hypothetical protein BBO99_00008487 [Phytophthora kernoviae]
MITVATLATLTVIGAISIDHDKVQPFPQPEPVTVSEKAAIKFKPQLNINFGCGVYPAVNAAGETNGGLKGTGGVSGCKVSLLGPQNVIVWIDNPALETSKILGLSTSQSSGYYKAAPVPAFELINGTTPMMSLKDSYLYPTTGAGDFHDLIMWDQLTDAARAALNTTDFGSAKVPFSDDNFSEKLENAWPF